jgi:hypothetical protein
LVSCHKQKAPLPSLLQIFYQFFSGFYKVLKVLEARQHTP